MMRARGGSEPGHVALAQAFQQYDGDNARSEVFLFEDGATHEFFEVW
jgi:hypothetical protein